MDLHHLAPRLLRDIWVSNTFSVGEGQHCVVHKMIELWGGLHQLTLTLPCDRWASEPSLSVEEKIGCIQCDDALNGFAPKGTRTPHDRQGFKHLLVLAIQD